MSSSDSFFSDSIEEVLKTVSKRRKAAPQPDRKRKSPRAEKDPTKPKRGLTSYFCFLQEERPDLVAARPGLKIGEVTKVLAARWKKLGPAEREKFIKMADEKKDRYLEERKIWEAKQKMRPDRRTTRGNGRQSKSNGGGRCDDGSSDDDRRSEARRDGPSSAQSLPCELSLTSLKSGCSSRRPRRFAATSCMPRLTSSSGRILDESLLKRIKRRQQNSVKVDADALLKFIAALQRNRRKGYELFEGLDGRLQARSVQDGAYGMEERRSPPEESGPEREDGLEKENKPGHDAALMEYLMSVEGMCRTNFGRLLAKLDSLEKEMGQLRESHLESTEKGGNRLLELVGQLREFRDTLLKDIARSDNDAEGASEVEKEQDEDEDGDDDRIVGFSRSSHVEPVDMPSAAPRADDAVSDPTLSEETKGKALSPATVNDSCDWLFSVTASDSSFPRPKMPSVRGSCDEGYDDDDDCEWFDSIGTSSQAVSAAVQSTASQRITQATSQAPVVVKKLIEGESFSKLSGVPSVHEPHSSRAAPKLPLKGVSAFTVATRCTPSYSTPVQRENPPASRDDLPLQTSRRRLFSSYEREEDEEEVEEDTQIEKEATSLIHPSVEGLDKLVRSTARFSPIDRIDSSLSSSRSSLFDGNSSVMSFSSKYNPAKGQRLFSRPLKKGKDAWE